MPWATYSTISKSWLNTRTLRNMLLTLLLWAWLLNYTSSLNLWLALPLLKQLLHLRYLCLLLLLALLSWFRLPCLNSKWGQNSLFPLTSLVNEALVEPFSTPVCYICTWPQSSSATTKRKSSGPLPFSRIDGLWDGPKTSFTRRQILAFFSFNPGLTLNNSSGVSSFWST